MEPENRRSTEKVPLSVPSCNFCYLNETENDEENFILYRSPYWIVQLYIHTNLIGHVNIIPRRHIDTIKELFDEEIWDLVTISQLTVKVLKEATGRTGINWCYQEGETSGAQLLGHFHIQFASRSSSDAGFIRMLCNADVVVCNYKTFATILRELFLKHSHVERNK